MVRKKLQQGPCPFHSPHFFFCLVRPFIKTFLNKLKNTNIILPKNVCQVINLFLQTFMFITIRSFTIGTLDPLFLRLIVFGRWCINSCFWSNRYLILLLLAILLFLVLTIVVTTILFCSFVPWLAAKACDLEDLRVPI